MDKILYKLDVFEGPLDLMLHLISKNKLDIKDIKISVLLDQYISHIRSMQECGIYIRSEFLNMISRLIYIKTLSLLPQAEEEQTLKKQLAEELIAHQELNLISKFIFDNINFEIFTRDLETINSNIQFNGIIDIHAFISSYIKAYTSAKKTIKKTDEKLPQLMSKRIVSVYSMLISILRKLKKSGYCKYSSLFNNVQNKSSIIALFLAVLELIKNKRILLENSDKDIIIRLNNTKTRKKVKIKN